MKLLIFLFFLCSQSWGQIEHVCASGCGYTTMAAAYTAAGPLSIIQIDDNSITNEAVTIGKNIAGIQGLNSGIVWASAVTVALNISSGLTQAFFLKNITIKQSSSGLTIDWSGLGIGSSVTIFNANIYNSTSGCVRIDVILTSANQFSLINSKIVNTGSSNCFIINSAIITTNPILLQNDLFVGSKTVGTGVLDNSSVDTNSVLNCQNCSILNCGLGFSLKAVFTCSNDIFLGNTTDLSITAPAALSQFSYTGFGQQASGAGTSCIYGLTASQELCDNNNYWLSPASKTRNKGTSITGITNTLVGLNGILHGNACTNGNDDMGCNPYSPALCGGYGLGK